jgi:hypothetical protein
MQSPGEWIRQVGTHNAIYQIVCLVSASVILLLSSYGLVAAILGHIDVVGATLVNVEFPPPGISPVFVKPITLLMIAALGLTFSGLELLKPKFLKQSNTAYTFVKMVAFVGAALAAYEVMYNFAIWTAEISTNSLLGILNPDFLTNQFPNPQTPWNLVFATKISTTLLAVGLYVFYYIRQIEREKLQLML